MRSDFLIHFKEDSIEIIDKGELHCIGQDDFYLGIPYDVWKSPNFKADPEKAYAYFQTLQDRYDWSQLMPRLVSLIDCYNNSVPDYILALPSREKYLLRPELFDSFEVLGQTDVFFLDNGDCSSAFVHTDASFSSSRGEIGGNSIFFVRNNKGDCRMVYVFFYVGNLDKWARYETKNRYGTNSSVVFSLSSKQYFQILELIENVLHIPYVIDPRRRTSLGGAWEVIKLWRTQRYLSTSRFSKPHGCLVNAFIAAFGNGANGLRGMRVLTKDFKPFMLS